MIRRDFLARLTASAATAALGHGGMRFADAAQNRAATRTFSKLERISISTWSLHNYFRVTRREDFNLPGPMLSLLDFPALIADRYNVHHFEFCAVHFASTEPAYLREVKYALLHTRSTVVNMPLDIKESATFSDPDREARMASIDAVKHWVDVAHQLGATSVRVDPGKVDPTNLARTADSYKTVAAYAQARGIHVIIENLHGYGTGRPEELVQLIKLIGAGRVGSLPDFGNFPDEATRERGLKMLFPYAQVVCHTKGLEFDADGAETRYDFPKAMEISKKAGFRGFYSIEFDGPGDPYAGIQKTLDELLKYL